MEFPSQISNFAQFDLGGGGGRGEIPALKTL